MSKQKIQGSAMVVTRDRLLLARELNEAQAIYKCLELQAVTIKIATISHHLINFDGDAYQRRYESTSQALELTLMEVTKTKKWFKGER